MNSKAYWEKRAAERMVGYAADAEKTANTLGKAYQSVSAYLSDEAAKVLKSFSNAFDLSEAEARRILSDLPDEKMTAALKAAVGNIADPQKRKEAEALISSPAYAYRMNRLKELDEKTSELCGRLYNAEVKTDSKFFSAEIDKAYKQTVFDVQKGTGVSAAFDLVPQSRIDRILNTQWSGEHFSKRVWGNTQALADGLKNDMLVGIMSGKSEQRMAEDIMNRCAVGAFEARRLVRTETTYISNQAELEGYKELDIEKYQFSACLDNRTSELCSDLDGKVFDVKDAVPGKNLPPMHPFCRSTTLPVLPDEEDLDRELAELGDEIGADVDFDEWVKGLQETEDGRVVYRSASVDKSGESGIIKSGSDDVALEYQRYGRNKSTLVNKTYIASGEYRRKFDSVSDNSEVNKAVYNRAKTAFKHRSGTNFEDMYWIDSDSGKEIAKEVNSTAEQKIVYSEKTKITISSYERKKLIAIHTHPNSMPPSAADFNSCCRNGYKRGYVACHDGKVFAYTSEQEISEELYSLYLSSFGSEGLTDYEAQLKTLEKLKENHLIDFWEVT
ncbi:MAG: minor capsid protein [Ruminiclostridium sp.]